jgi:inner membrane protein
MRKVVFIYCVIAIIFVSMQLIMPTIITHSIFAALLGRFYRPDFISIPIWIVGALSASLPDMDVLGFRFGIAYGSPYGHRGFTHSIFFALLWAGLCTLFMNKWIAGKNKLISFVFLFLCTVSHGLLDSITSGGKGVAFFFPFDNTRYFMPWRPVKVSGFGIDSLLSQRGVSVLLSEFKIILLPTIILLICYVLAKKKIDTSKPY